MQGEGDRRGERGGMGREREGEKEGEYEIKIRGVT